MFLGYPGIHPSVIPLSQELMGEFPPNLGHVHVSCRADDGVKGHRAHYVCKSNT